MVKYRRKETIQGGIINMAIKVAINGFGRIGRLAYRLDGR
jgi:hypothetical protein